MQLVNRKNLVIAGGVVLLLLLVGGLFLAQQARNSSNTTTATEGQDTQTVDKNSGETISNIDGKSPETVGILPDAPLYLNMEEFLERGLTIDQLNSLKYALYQYTNAQNPKIKQVSITKDSAQTIPPNDDGKSSLTFNLVFDDGPKLNGSLVYFDDSSVELTITDSAGKKIFESGTITDKSIYLQQ